MCRCPDGKYLRFAFTHSERLIWKFLCYDHFKNPMKSFNTLWQNYESILDPIFLTISIDYLLELIAFISSSVCSYADDTNVVIMDKSFDGCVGKYRHIYNEINFWVHMNKLAWILTKLSAWSLINRLYKEQRISSLSWIEIKKSSKKNPCCKFLRWLLCIYIFSIVFRYWLTIQFHWLC